MNLKENVVVRTLKPAWNCADKIGGWASDVVGFSNDMPSARVDVAWKALDVVRGVKGAVEGLAQRAGINNPGMYFFTEEG